MSLANGTSPRSGRQRVAQGESASPGNVAIDRPSPRSGRQCNPGCARRLLWLTHKANTSKWAKSVRRGFGWQEGYSAFTVSESQAERVRHYIQNQREHHARSSFRDELIALLEAHGVKYDPDRI
jgi:hypothetical protein